MYIYVFIPIINMSSQGNSAKPYYNSVHANTFSAYIHQEEMNLNFLIKTPK